MLFNYLISMRDKKASSGTESFLLDFSTSITINKKPKTAQSVSIIENTPDAALTISLTTKNRNTTKKMTIEI